MTLVAVVYLLCQEQVESRDLSPTDFAKSLPSPPDTMLEAVEDAIVGFFPSGRASHVREVLTKYAEMNEQTDAILIKEMTAAINDPDTKKGLTSLAKKQRKKLMDQMLTSDLLLTD